MGKYQNGSAEVCRESIYLSEELPYLVNYLRDGRLEISNNRAERSIKPFVIDRKNFCLPIRPMGLLAVL